MAVPIRSPEDIAAAAAAGRAVWDVLNRLVETAAPGVRTADLDALARGLLAEAGAEPLLLGFPADAGPFPGAVSITVNEEAAHGLPGPRLLRPGDLVSIDLAARVGGWCADAARSLAVGGIALPGDASAMPEERPSNLHQKADASALAAAALATLEAGIRAARPGIRWSALAGAMSAAAGAAGVRLVGGLAGHGIGRELHEPPAAPFFPRPGEDFVLQPGMILTLEPAVTRGSGDLVWTREGTALTRDRAWVCHEERTLAVIRGGVQVLTA